MAEYIAFDSHKGGWQPLDELARTGCGFFLRLAMPRTMSFECPAPPRPRNFSPSLLEAHVLLCQHVP